MDVITKAERPVSQVAEAMAPGRRSRRSGDSLLDRVLISLSTGQEPERLHIALVNVLTVALAALLVIGVVEAIFLGGPQAMVLPAAAAVLIAWTSVMRRRMRPQVVPLLAVAAVLAAGFLIWSSAEGLRQEFTNSGPVAILMMTGALAVMTGTRHRIRVVIFVGALMAVAVGSVQTALGEPPLAIGIEVATSLISVLTLYAGVTILRKALDVGSSRYQGLLETAPVAVIELDMSNVEAGDRSRPLATVLHINPEARRALGYEGPPGPYDPRYQAIPSPVVELAQEVVGSGHRSGTRVLNQPSGGDKAYLVSWRVLDPSYRRVIFSAVDITIQQAAERALSEQVRARDQFIATVSHELRTPLAAALGFLELIEDDSVAGAEREELLHLALTQTRDMADIVQDLLVAARASTGRLVIQLEEVDVRTIVTEALNAFETICIDVPPRLAAIADPVRVKQIIRNLATNALRYGGPERRVVARQEGSWVILETRDSGPPLPDEFQQQMFEPYGRGATTDLPTESVGLGLTVARTLAEMMNGDLCYAHDGRESVFCLRLPAADAASGRRPATTSP
jgi:signal transduction histidine kinase